MNQINFETCAIGADRIIAPVPGGKLPLPLGEAWGEGLRRIHFFFFFVQLLRPHPNPLPVGEGTSFRRYIAAQIEQQIGRRWFDAELADHADDLATMHRRVIGDMPHLIDQAH